MPSDAEFLQRLLATFRVEADEHLEAMASGLLELERRPSAEDRAMIVERIYREAHSLKGAARAVNLAEIETLCHALESVFAGLKGDRLPGSPPLFDLLQQALTVLGELLAAPGGASLKPALLQRLQSLAQGANLEASAQEVPEAPAAAPEPVAPAPGAATIRVATAKLDAVMRQAEELFAPRLAAGQHAVDLGEAVAAFAAWKKRRFGLQPSLRSLERSLPQQGKKRAGELRHLLDYLEAEALSLKAIEDRLAALQRASERDHRTLSGIVDALVDDVKELHLLPCASLLATLPRLARELARDRGKEVKLTISGGEIEIDRRILEEIKDPLSHLLRNSIDHGIEPPAARQAGNKPVSGAISIAVAQKDSNKVEIVFADDGAGMDVAKLKAAAARQGLVSRQDLENLDEREVLALSFRSGLSTSVTVTDLSGRGLGLAIVREKIERLSGSIVIETRPGQGTRFRIVLPLTLATFRGVLVCAAGQNFIIPAVHVERVARLAARDIRTLENRDTMPLDGQAVSLVRLSDVLELPRGSAESLSVVVLGLGLERIAFRVDAVVGEQEVLVKGLGRQLARVRNLAGASVLGTGQVVAVLNVSDLMKSAVKSAGSQPPAAVAEPGERVQHSILVVEDSITSRALLKNILESAGYQVTTAVDGLDAYTTLKTGAFDLVVSDVEMPRMDGFDLTARVRADKQLAGLPVVLVTALASREHRERGIDVGANAYIVKGSFDQSDLLEVIARLI
ncbi:gliding motility regulatory protein [mine drainage metagenome]|uniref:histidine kinase n=1 Tax=mine drainage metagenome TaxID=410659 RepID=A0A1J5SA39_9ZZZZ